MAFADVMRNYSALTAACLLVTRATYDAVGGFNEQDLEIAYNDVDFCLKIVDRGLRMVYVPDALLYHHESASRRDAPPVRPKEAAYLERVWSKYIVDDPFFNPNLDLASSDFRIGRPRARAERPRRQADPVLLP
jgi:GT2 family glycosyltransferase